VKSIKLSNRKSQASANAIFAINKYQKETLSTTVMMVGIVVYHACGIYKIQKILNLLIHLNQIRDVIAENAVNH
jgi:uncharacterized membrane protein